MITENAINNCPEGREGFTRRQFLRGMTLFGGMTVLSASGIRYTLVNWIGLKKNNNHRKTL